MSFMNFILVIKKIKKNYFHTIIFQLILKGSLLLQLANVLIFIKCHRVINYLLYLFFHYFALNFIHLIYKKKFIV